MSRIPLLPTAGHTPEPIDPDGAALRKRQRQKRKLVEAGEHMERQVLLVRHRDTVRGAAPSGQTWGSLDKRELDYVYIVYSLNRLYAAEANDNRLPKKVPDHSAGLVADIEALLRKTGVPEDEWPARAAMIERSLTAPLTASISPEARSEVTAPNRGQPVAAASDPVGPPLPELTEKDIAAIIARGKERPWADHKPAYRGRVFEFVRDTYGEWIPGLLQGHLKRADRSLYLAFVKNVERKGLPGWLDLPTENCARLRSIGDPQRIAALRAGRALAQEGSRILRAAHLKT